MNHIEHVKYLTKLFLSSLDKYQMHDTHTFVRHFREEANKMLLALDIMDQDTVRPLRTMLKHMLVQPTIHDYGYGTDTKSAITSYILDTIESWDN